MQSYITIDLQQICSWGSPTGLNLWKLIMVLQIFLVHYASLKFRPDEGGSLDSIHEGGAHYASLKLCWLPLSWRWEILGILKVNFQICNCDWILFLFLVSQRRIFLMTDDVHSKVWWALGRWFGCSCSLLQVILWCFSSILVIGAAGLILPLSVKIEMDCYMIDLVIDFLFSSSFVEIRSLGCIVLWRIGLWKWISTGWISRLCILFFLW